jgi:hypothetical protein
MTKLFAELAEVKANVESLRRETQKEAAPKPKSKRKTPDKVLVNCAGSPKGYSIPLRYP